MRYRSPGKMKSIGIFNSYPELECFCTFIGYPKSGHSLVGSLLDAHPDIIIAHELNVLKCLKMRFSPAAIVSLLLQNSEYYSKRGRKWSEYTYLVPNQWNGRYQKLKVIGDKKGGGSAILLRRHPYLLAELMDAFPLRHIFIHVIRNPFDSITTLSKAVNKDLKTIIRLFTSMWEEASILKKKIPPGNWLDIHHEDFIADPRQGLMKLHGLLGGELQQGYLNDCTSIVNPIPHKSRFTMAWTAKDIKSVEKGIEKHAFLKRYSYDGE